MHKKALIVVSGLIDGLFLIIWKIRNRPDTQNDLVFKDDDKVTVIKPIKIYDNPDNDPDLGSQAAWIETGMKLTVIYGGKSTDDILISYKRPDGWMIDTYLPGQLLRKIEQ